MKRNHSNFAVGKRLIVIIIPCFLLIGFLLFRYFAIPRNDAVWAVINCVMPEFSLDHGDNLIVEDKDCNGRILISLHSNGIEAIIIVQKVDTKNKQVYCYIDSCILTTYELFGRTMDDPTQMYEMSDIPDEVINDFKKQNDWNQDLNNEKMYAISFK